ncbi:MAG TPA: molybdate ABC transporter permease subunit [Spirochaetales bacterium]|nr:molybdate ABC transporter permease subunit [Spirochaetales bacterium]HPS14581.1 molybdate ABC transporter permease subunit [Spirochaetales bacterium]
MNPWGPLLLSVRVALIATAISFVLGLLFARLLTRKTVRLSFLWEGLILLPMVFPPTITGYLLLLLLGKRGPLGSILDQIGIHIVFTWPAAVIASATVSLPLMYQNCKAALLGVNKRYIDAARTLGLSEGRIFRQVIFPLALPGILGGVALAFARALGEFGTTLMIAGNIPGRTQTMPLALYSAVEGGRSAEANMYLLITVVISFALIAVVGLCQKRAAK